MVSGQAKSSGAYRVCLYDRAIDMEQEKENWADYVYKDTKMAFEKKCHSISS